PECFYSVQAFLCTILPTLPCTYLFLLLVYLYLTKYDKSIVSKHLNFGERIRKLREDKGLLLRQSAAFLEVDTAFVSKVERGERKASKEQVERLAQFLEVDKDELITLW